MNNAWHRPRTTVDKGFFEIAPTYTMFLLADMKNNGMSWQEIGDKLNVSATLVWKVAKGRCRSNLVDAALGIDELHVTVPQSQVKKHPSNPNDTGRLRVALEFGTKQEQWEMIDMLDFLGKTRKEQSLELKAILDDYCARRTF